MKVTRKSALGVLALTVAALIAPLTSASADRGDQLKGGCGFQTTSNVATNGANQGKIYVVAVSQDASGVPSGASVTCWIDVNGVEQVGTRLGPVDDIDSPAGETGIIVGQRDISFVSVPGDNISVCQQVTFEDGSTWTAGDGNVGTDCPSDIEITEQPVIDLINSLTGGLDLTDCPVLKLLAGSYANGLIVVTSEGDVSINDPQGLIGKVYDCPPSGDGSGDIATSSSLTIFRVIPSL